MTISAGISVEGSGGGAIPSVSDTLYRFMVFPFPPGHFVVRSFRGRESLSGLYSFDIIVTGPEVAEGVVERLILGQRATLILRAGKAPRAFHGVVSAVKIQGVRAADHVTQYKIRLVPRLWLLKKRRRSRIFQQKRVDEIIGAVLAEMRVNARFQLRREYPIREYCTQYEETDYQFVTRIAAEAGLFFSFHQASPLLEEAIAAFAATLPSVGGPLVGPLASAALSTLFAAGESVVFSDDVSGYVPVDDGSLLTAAAGALGAPSSASMNVGGVSIAATIPSPTLYYLSIQGTSTPAFDKITRFEPAFSVRTNATMYREYDPERPQAELRAMANLSAGDGAIVSVGASLSPESGLSANVSIDPARAIAAALGPLLDTPDLERYDHHANFLFSKWGYAADEPGLMLKQERRRASVASGESTCPGIAPGSRFRLEDHPAGQLNREYVITAVDHEGFATPQGPDRPEVYKNAFSCAPSDVVYCPPRPRRKVITTALTATVVGPAGEEIYTDASGQVKVHFHWDREGRRDETSSCWIRTMQAWGGAGWGTQFIPRVGMEVVVAFDGGDPDRPIILGCVYNGTHPPSFLLPADKTRSGIRTQTSPGGRGHNELSFEDKLGGEQIYVHAQRDLDEVVRRNHTVDVACDEYDRIGGNRRASIEGDSTLRVAGAMSESVKGDRSSEVTGNRIDVTSGSLDLRVTKDATARVEGRERREVRESADLVYGDDLTVKVKGSKTVLVGRHDAKRSYSMHVEGTVSNSSTEKAEIVSEKELVLRCGRSSVRITPDAIELDAPEVRVKAEASRIAMADDGIRMRSSGSAAALLGGSIALKSGGGASLGLGGEAALAGSQVLLNSPAQASDPPFEEPAAPGTVALTDEAGNPLAYQRYLIVFEDGSERSGVLDKEGRVEVDAKTPGRIYFPDLKDAAPE